MKRNKHLYFCIILILISNTIFSQSVSVIGKDEITSSADGEFYNPQFNYKGDKILFTGDSFKGLWLFETAKNSLKKLNDNPGAGYNPVFSSDDQSVYFRSDRFENMTRISSMYKQNLNSGKIDIILKDQNNLLAPLKSTGNTVLGFNSNEVIPLEKNQLNKTGVDNESIVFINDSKIVYQSGSLKKTLAPLGEGNYIWPSLSPDGKYLLFTKAGKGTYVSDLNGVVLYDLGKANYPVWGKEGNWVVFMEDKDDGQNIISSDIKIISLETLQIFNLTNTSDVIEMYPDYCAAADAVVFHTLTGKIIKLNLKFN